MNNRPLRVSEYMTRWPVTVSPDTEIMRAVFILVEKDVSGVPVVDENEAVVGMLTERDCISAALNAGYFDEPAGSVSDYMSRVVTTAAPDDGLMDIATRFKDSQYRRFPVMEKGRLVGLISRRDVLRALCRHTWFKND